MKNFEWEPNFSVGLPELDNDHYLIFSKINEIEVHIIDPNVKFDNDNISSLLKRLFDYMIIHFQSEEELMKKYKYPKAAIHVRRHQEFSEKFKTMIESRTPLTIENVNLVFVFLRNWWEYHVTIEDKDYASYIYGVEKNCD